MNKYYFTFMQSQYALKDYWIEIEAETSEIAREIMVAHWKDRWGFQYDEKNHKPEYYPKGCLLNIKQLT